MRRVYGPVPSWRLGRSLGVDPVPLETCNWNCVYCRLGRTRPVVNERPEPRGWARVVIRMNPGFRNRRRVTRRDAEAETTDVKNYIRLAALAEEAGLIALKQKMEEQAGDEDEHGQEMKRLPG